MSALPRNSRRMHWWPRWSSGRSRASRTIPGAWLMATAKHRAIDRLRRNKRLERKLEEFGRELACKEMAVPDLASALDDEVGDDLLRLMFISCHPVLSTEARVALTLRLAGRAVNGRDRACVPGPGATIAQRIVRAKRTLTEARVPFEVPRGAELAARLASVLEVIYLIFNEGYSATAGDDWIRPGLCEDALRLGRILAECVPQEPEVHGLVALDGNSSVALPGARRTVRRAHFAAGAKPRAVGSTAHPSWPGRAGASRATGRRAWARTCSRLPSPPVTRGR